MAERRRQPASVRARLPSAFFGVDEPTLSRATCSRSAPSARWNGDPAYGQSDALFWADPFDRAARAAQSADLRAVRLAAEWWSRIRSEARPPPLQPMPLSSAARSARYDALARNLRSPAKCVRCTPTPSRTGQRQRYRAARPVLVPLLDVGAARSSKISAPLYERAWRYRAGMATSRAISSGTI